MSPRPVGVAAAVLVLATSGVAHGGDARWEVGLAAGAAIPRGDLHPGPLLGLGFATRAGRAGRAARLHLEVGGDWMQLRQQDPTLVSPPAYPRARAALIQRSDLFALHAGASYDALAIGASYLYAGVAAGAALHRASFEAFGTVHSPRSLGPLAELRVGIRGATRSLAWGLELAWRETTHDLGVAGSAGEETASGLLIVVGLGVQR